MSTPTERSGNRIWAISGSLLVTLCATCFCTAQSAPSPTIAPLQGSWATIDERFVFLTVELSSVEASMNAVNKALAAAGRDQSKAQLRAQNYAAGNTRMDRQGGGPVDWQDFYGKTAASFYYHSNGSIHVQGQSNFQLNAQYQGKDMTTVERPPQFDFIYRANSDAQAQAQTDAAALGNKIDQLLARRRELEAEQSSLWCKIALRGLSSRELSFKPLYRYELPPSPTDKQSTQRFAAISAECKFMRTVNLLVKQAQPALDGDQSPVYAQLKQAIDSAHDDLAASLLSLPVLADALNDNQSYIGQFNAAAQRLDDVSQNLVDAYRLAGDGDRADDDQRKDNFRGQFQQTIIDFAATVLTADEALTDQAAEWNVNPDSSRIVTTDPNAKPLIVPAPLRPPPSSTNINPSPQPTLPPNNPPDTTSSNAQHDQPAPAAQSSAAQPSVAQPIKPPDTNAINAERSQLATAQTRILGGAPFDSDQELSQVDKPYEINGVYRPVSDGGNLKITVYPGVEIRGGKIDMGRKGAGTAQLLLTGTNSRPIILRHVEIDQPLGGVFIANHVIFDQCAFRKIGGWFAYFSSKWPMDQCLLYRCNFGTLKAVDYGFNLTNCTFVEMDFPEIVEKPRRDQTLDYMDHLRKDWNTLRSCSFVNCSIPPTVFWCSEESNFWNCTFLPGAAFQSDTPTAVVAFVRGATGDTFDQINAANPPVRAPLSIDLRDAPFPVLRWAPDCPIPELRHDDRYASIVLDGSNNN